MRDKTPEDLAREMLHRMGIEDALTWSSGEVIELANLIAENKRLRNLVETPIQWATDNDGNQFMLRRTPTPNTTIVPVDEPFTEHLNFQCATEGCPFSGDEDSTVQHMKATGHQGYFGIGGTIIRAR